MKKLTVQEVDTWWSDMVDGYNEYSGKSLLDTAVVATMIKDLRQDLLQAHKFIRALTEQVNELESKNQPESKERGEDSQ